MSKKNINKINLKVRELVKNKKYFVRLKSNNNKNYWRKKFDPDGNKRLMLSNFERKKFIQNNQLLINKIHGLKNVKKVLDLGCGAGFLLSAINNKFERNGIEINESAINKAKKYAKIFRRDLNLRNIELEKKFDLIICYHVIEHLKNPKNLMKNIIKYLKRDKYLIIGTPDFDSAMARLFGDKFRLLHDKTHISLFSVDSLTRFLRDNGFSIISIDYPYFETDYFNKNKILEVFNNKGYSPPFYGNVFTILAKKK